MGQDKSWIKDKEKVQKIIETTFWNVFARRFRVGVREGQTSKQGWNNLRLIPNSVNRKDPKSHTQFSQQFLQQELKQRNKHLAIVEKPNRPLDNSQKLTGFPSYRETDQVILR